MLHLGESHEKIALCLGISDSTVSNYAKKYQAEGLDLYLQDHYHGYEGKLNEEEQSILCAELDHHLYKSTAEIAVLIREKFGKTYTYQGLAPLLKRLGFSYKKTKLVPCAADLERASGFCERF